MQLAGTYHPLLYLLKQVSIYFPNIETVHGLWKGYDEQLYSSFEDTPLQGYQKVEGQELRKSNPTPRWEKEVLLFTNGNNSSSQMSFKDGEKLNVLMLFFPSPIDKYNDVLFIHFSEQTFLKSINLTFKGINEQERFILQQLLNQILSVEYKKAVEERRFLLNMEHYNKKQQFKIEELTKELKMSKELYSSSLQSIINNIVEEWEDKIQRKINIHESFVSKIAKERLTIKEIRVIIKEAVYLAYHINLSSSKIILTGAYLNTGKSKFSKETTSTHADKTTNKVKLLLDRYEKAAQKIDALGGTLNGKNIAAQLSPPVTPPAITDAIKKNKSAIAFLLRKYPEKWPLARKAVRPISQLDQPNYQGLVGT